MTMVSDTAIPYAAAIAVELPKPITRPTVATIRVQLICGM
jgi:hypothetical protein